MGRLIYSAIVSLDGYIADPQGNFDWAAPDEEIHRFVNERERAVGIYLYGRRMYEVMAGWETMPAPGTPSEPFIRDYAAIWRAADKIVFSRTVHTASTSRTRIQRSFDREEVRLLKEESARDLSIGGAGLAAEALRAGLVDECGLFVTPHVVGGGIAALPGGIRMDLELRQERPFRNGTVFLRYGIRSSP